jgi:hypothetical protein
MASKRFLGPLDAADDKQLQHYFISPEDVADILEPQSDVIYGGKGIGKTALRRALTELHRSKFFATGTIDLNNINFLRVYQELEKLERATGEDPVALARVTWRNVIVMYFLELVAENASNETLREAVDHLLKDEYFSQRNAPTRVLNQIQRFFERLGAIALEDDDGRSTVDLVETIRSTVEDFPRSVEFRKVLSAACEAVRATGKKVVVCVDGFDTIVDHFPASRKAIFAGLIGAVYRLSDDPAVTDALCVKGFLPKELTHEARAIDWDRDKRLYNTKYLFWDESSLKEFIARRLTPHLRSKKTDFDGIWHEFMPKEARNSVHGIDEPSFGYILRHTQFRPRQLLYQVQMILNGWDSKSNDFRVDRSFLPPSVAASNKKLADLAVNQLEYARPGIGSFIRSFGGSTSTVRYDECFSKITRMFEPDSPITARKIYEELFDFGVLGLARCSSIVSNGTIIKVRFVYVGEGITAPYANDDDIVALCPMFHDYAGCTRSEYGAVVPSAV